MKTQTQFTPGTRVAYARAFLRNTGQVTGWAAFARGAVVSVDPKPFGKNVVVRVQWDDGSGPNGVLSCNLVRVDRMHLEAV
jgi:hypothetical protein